MAVSIPPVREVLDGGDAVRTESPLSDDAPWPTGSLTPCPGIAQVAREFVPAGIRLAGAGLKDPHDGCLLFGPPDRSD